MLDSTRLTQLRARKRQGVLVDRSLRSHADRVLAQLLPGDAARRSTASGWSRAIRAAHDVSDRSWSVTLFPAGWRLNVGRLLVTEILPGWQWMVVVDDAPRAVDLAPWRVPGRHQVLPTPHHFAAVPAEELGRLAGSIREVLAASARAAASTAPQTGFRLSWSAGVVEAIEALSAPLPR
ncbi:MAG: hypothetical protein AAF602_24080, partial [Myxococcota bacterium]